MRSIILLSEPSCLFKNSTKQLPTIHVKQKISKFDKLLNKHFFLTGQAHSAYIGKYVGGYAAGVIGVGMQSKGIFNDRIRANVELLIGAGGGGYLTVGHGGIAQYMTGLTYNFNNYLGVLMSIGKVFSLNNELNSTVMDLGLVIHFSTLTR